MRDGGPYRSAGAIRLDPLQRIEMAYRAATRPYEVPWDRAPWPPYTPDFRHLNVCGADSLLAHVVPALIEELHELREENVRLNRRLADLEEAVRQIVAAPATVRP